MVTLKQLRYLVALSNHGHFGKAARAVAISQPALSMQIRELEQVLGVVLVERGKGEVWLTPEGQEIVRRADAILAQVRDLSDCANASAALLSGTLRLGVIPSIAPFLLPHILPLIQKMHPKLKLEVRETQTEMLLAELGQGILDLLLLAVPVSGADVETLFLFEEAFVLAVASEKLQGRQNTSAELLIQEETLLLLEEGHCLRDQALNFCGKAGAEAMSSFGASSLTTLAQMVANGYGVTLLPQMCIDKNIPDERIALLQFSTPRPTRTIGLVWRKTSPKSADFLAFGRIVTRAADGPAPSITPKRKQRRKPSQTGKTGKATTAAKTIETAKTGRTGKAKV